MRKLLFLMLLAAGLVGCGGAQDRPLRELEPFSADETIYLNDVGGVVLSMQAALNAIEANNTKPLMASDLPIIDTTQGAELNKAAPDRLSGFRQRAIDAFQVYKNALTLAANGDEYESALNDAKSVLTGLQRELEGVGITNPPPFYITQ